MPKPKYQFGVLVFFLLISYRRGGRVVDSADAVSLAWVAVTHSIRMFGVTAGYYRDLGHRSYKLGRRQCLFPWCVNCGEESIQA